MPYLRSDSNVNPISNDLVIRNAFLVFRLVVLVLLTKFAFLSLIFASWNVNATLSYTNTASGTSIFIIFESCIVFFFVAYALMDFFLPWLRLSKTIIECGMIGVLSTFHIASAVTATVNSSATACRPSSEWNVCASASLLMPLTWLNSFICLGYFLTLFMAVMAHKNLYPGIWRKPLYDVEWFGKLPPQAPPKEKVVQDFLENTSKLDAEPLYGSYDVTEPGEKKHHRTDSAGESVSWHSRNIRRGVDLPFSIKPGQHTPLSSPPKKSAAFPPTLPLTLPVRTATFGSMVGSTSGSRFIERFRESTVLARSESASQYATHYHVRQDSFPRSVDDIDKPIPLPRLSEWISAEALETDMTGNSGKGREYRRWI